MDTLIIALLSFGGFIIAYHTYGRWLARRVFGLDGNAIVPSAECRDDVDFVPTEKQIVFGHHFTSIAGTGPIVGPALAVFWGWLPALLWVVLGSVFIGAVHDFGALVVSLRNRGQTVGEIAGRMISPRARVLFLLVLFFALTIVLAIFGLVIATLFRLYPESVLSVWIAMPLAIWVGLRVHRRGGQLLWPSLLALIVVYAAIVIGVRYLPIELPMENPVVGWTVILMIYCFFASVLPVWFLLQPRDYINSQQLIVALVLMVAGLAFAGITGRAQLFSSAPAISAVVPPDAPPIWPFLFITIACGACSGFHCLVSSGTSSKQLANESHALFVGYGSMLLEGALAVLVILACTAGLGIGITGSDGGVLTGRAAWLARYDASGAWANFGLGPCVAAFVDGGSNFISAVGVPGDVAIGIVAVLVACFAATTLDSATRLQRYVIQELGDSFRFKPMTNKYVATSTAVLLGLAVAMLPGAGQKAGTGGMILWPLFGATNQLLAGLAFLVTVFYLWRRSKPVLFALLPMLLMLLLPTWAMLWNMFDDRTGWFWHGKPLLFGFGCVILLLQAWIVVEAILIWPKTKGMLEEALPVRSAAIGLETEAGRTT